MNWEQLISSKRFGQEKKHNAQLEYRSVFERDYDRLIFSSPFRRLQNKTQVFPLPGNIFVHNRLTHSLEVSCVGRSIGNDVARELIRRNTQLEKTGVSMMGTITSSACLAHDLGNPPFGHSGEKAIATYFSEGKGALLKNKIIEEMGEGQAEILWNDIIHFDGNANTFRILTHQYEGRREGGFVMTYSTLASIVKYPYTSVMCGKKSKFGFFATEVENFRRIADELGLIKNEDNGSRLSYARYPLVYMVEAADDICYEIMDIEDAHKLHIISTDETIRLLLNFFEPERAKRIEQSYPNVTDANERIIYLRSCVINELEQECVRAFLENESKILEGKFRGSLIEHICPRCKRAYEACSDYAYKHIYRSQEVVDVELAGYRIIDTLLDLYVSAVCEPNKAYSKLLIDRVPSQYQLHADTLHERIIGVLDYITGMTDIYALDLYQKIKGMALPII
ncbi:MAG: dNTP triphosphohydrolase [Prevotellaceae bacterium]|nr:dNTP triphosphohydrolase [Candidatus Faecinaster equi]